MSCLLLVLNGNQLKHIIFALEIRCITNRTLEVARWRTGNVVFSKPLENMTVSTAEGIKSKIPFKRVEIPCVFRSVKFRIAI